MKNQIEIATHISVTATIYCYLYTYIKWNIDVYKMITYLWIKWIIIAILSA